MTKEPVFSVVVVSYNKELWKATIESILHQSYPAIELVFCDDCTPDFSLAEVQDYIEQRKTDHLVKLHLIQSEQNLGTVAMLRRAHKFCTGKYLTHIAGDDAYSHNHVLDYYAKGLERKAADVLGVYAKSIICDSHLVPQGKTSFSVEEALKMNEMAADGQFMRLAMGCCIHMGATAFIREELMEAGDFDPSYRLIEDWPFLLRSTRSGNRFFFINHDAILYRGGGVTGTTNGKTTIQEWCFRDHLRLYEREILPNIRFFSYKVKKHIYLRYRKDRADITTVYGELSERTIPHIICMDFAYVWIEIGKQFGNFYQRCEAKLLRLSGR